MANAVVASWTACVKELQRLVEAAAAAGPCRVYEGQPYWADLKPYQRCVDKLDTQSPLPHAAWKRLVQEVQVTRKLAALSVQALQQQLGPVLPLACTVLAAWLGKAAAAIRASPGSNAAATVQQQLRQSRLLQHLGPGMDAAAAWLAEAKAAVAAAAAAAPTTASSTNSTAAADMLAASNLQLPYTAVEADLYCTCLLDTFESVARVLSPTERILHKDALPAAPAAVRLCLSAFQAHSALQQLDQLSSDHVPGQQRLFMVQHAVAVLLSLAREIDGDAAAAVQSCPGAEPLLLSPELVSGMAVMSVVTVLGLDTSSQVGTGAADAPATRGSRRGGGTGRKRPGTRGQQQQNRLPLLQQAASGSGGSCSGLSNGVRLGSLTPLSRSLFDILGVAEETMLHAAELGRPTVRTSLEGLQLSLEAFGSLLAYQVVQAKGAFNARMLLQQEAEMLLSLMLLQLTSSIPDSCPAALAAQDIVCHGCCSSLWFLQGECHLHKLLRPAVDTSPQLALQLLPSPHSQLPLRQSQQQQQQQQQASDLQQQQQPAEWCALAPSTALLTQLLPLLTQHCTKQLQLHHQQQQAAALPSGLPPSTCDGSALQWNWFSIDILLVCSVVPAISGAAAAAASTGQAQPLDATTAAAAETDNSDTAATTDNSNTAAAAAAAVTYPCVLHAQDAFLANACGIISTFEAALRCAAAEAQAATASAVPLAGAGAGAPGSISSKAVAEGDSDGPNLSQWAELLLQVCYHQVPAESPNPAALLMLVRAAGPGSPVQRQLHSLLATMVKLAGWGALEPATRLKFLVGAACAAQALLTNAAEQHVSAARTCGSSDAKAAAAALPALRILGRCFMLAAEFYQNQLAAEFYQNHRQQQQRQHDSSSGQEQPQPSNRQEQQQPSSQQQQQQQPSSGQGQQQPSSRQEHQSSSRKEQQQQEDEDKRWELHIPMALSVVLHWLASGSTCDQLAAVGYAPLPLLQELQQLQAAFQGSCGGQPDAAEIALVKSAGLALCSFAVPCMCNNPSCTSLSAMTELVSVSGRSCICGGCRTAHYCGRACQRAVWKQHKPVCAALSAAAGSSGAGVGAGLAVGTTV